MDRVEVEINELQVYLGVQSASQPHPHLEDGTVYRPVRSTILDKIKNFLHQIRSGGVIGRLPDYTLWKKLPSPCLANRGFSFGNFAVRACRMPTFPGGAAMRRLSTFLTPSQKLQLPLLWEWNSHLATCPISRVHLRYWPAVPDPPGRSNTWCLPSSYMKKRNW